MHITSVVVPSTKQAMYKVPPKTLKRLFNSRPKWNKTSLANFKQEVQNANKTTHDIINAHN